MRRDYKYIEKACAICIITTEKADLHLEQYTNAYIDGEIRDDFMELLLFIQDAYVCCRKDIEISIDEIAATINREYCKDLPESDGISRDVIVQAFVDGYIGVRIAIWDDSSLRCFLSSLLDHVTEELEESCRNAPSCQFSLSASANGLLWLPFEHSGPFYDPWKAI